MFLKITFTLKFTHSNTLCITSHTLCIHFVSFTLNSVSDITNSPTVHFRNFDWVLKNLTYLLYFALVSLFVALDAALFLLSLSFAHSHSLTHLVSSHSDNRKKNAITTTTANGFAAIL